VKIALIGAGGKMGSRITDNLLVTDHEVLYVEVSDNGQQLLHSKGLAVTSQQEAVQQADAVILAVPDAAIEAVAREIVADMQTNALLMLLDPAAAYLEKIPKRGDVALFVAHPCHPPIFNDETTPEAKRDYFGGVAAKQAIVCALVQGTEEHYAVGEYLGRIIYAPVMRSHRLTLEQMATLEPAMAETIGATVALLLSEAMGEAVNKGVPQAAARDFMLGHLNILLAVSFGVAGNPLSDACLVAVEFGKEHLLKDDWQQLLTAESVREQIEKMLKT